MNEDGGSRGLAADDAGRIDPAVVARLYAEHADQLRAFLIGVLRSSELAGEVLQSTFSRALEVGHSARQETLKGWLFRVAFNEAMALRRREKLDQKSIRRLAWSRPRHDESPEDNVSRREVVDSMRTAMKTLPDEQQTVVRMRIYEEKTFALIAEELGLPLGTVLTRMRLALKKLRNQLKSDE